jgi:membrane fusion protein (multidrug efflux system)
LPKLEGESFKAGETLIAFDCRKYAAEVSAAKAQARARELVMANNRRLLAKGAIGGNEVRVSEAEYEQARADVQALQARTGSCEFKAPFDGRLVERIVQEHESPAPNQPLIRIVDMTRLEVETIIPSKWLSRVRPGDAFSFTVDETGETLAAEVVRMGATVDPVSQTIKAYGVLRAPGLSVLPGMSGTATFRLAGS